MQDEIDTLEKQPIRHKIHRKRVRRSAPWVPTTRRQADQGHEEGKKAKERFITRVNKMVDQLFNAQNTIARGQRTSTASTRTRNAGRHQNQPDRDQGLYRRVEKKMRLRMTTSRPGDQTTRLGQHVERCLRQT